MEWLVIKMGSLMFDTLHAYGLGLLLGYAYEQPVLLEDEGCWYRLSHTGSRLLHASCHLLDEIMKLPVDAHSLVEEPGTPTQERALLLANLDGLLAALFTYPVGIHVCSLDDVRQKQHLDAAAPAKSLMKVRDRFTHWKSLLQGSLRDPSHWLDDVLDDYHPAHAQCPVPMPKRSSADITIPMTLDPTFSYDVRRQRSDGTTTIKVNMAVRGTRFAALLAYLGAMRFLRAQRVSGELVNYTLPVVTQILLSPELALPPLAQASHLTLESALLAQSIQYALVSPVSKATWQTLVFQTLQPQGMQQPISIRQGTVDLAWLEYLKRQMGRGPLLFWQRLFRTAQKDLPYERMFLEEALLAQRASSYLTHLEDVARLAAQRASNGEDVYVYSAKEVQIIMNTMEDSSQLPLRPLLERKAGTLRFGQALRLLKSSSRSAAAHDILDDLEQVQTRDQLVRVLYQLAEECQLLAAKTDYVILPSEEDFLFLSDDVIQYGACTIAGLVMLLSSLRYPKSEESPQRDALTYWSLLRAILRTMMSEATVSNALPPTTVVTDLTLLEGENSDDSLTNHYL
jgi:hypothetical protein